MKCEGFFHVGRFPIFCVLLFFMSVALYTDRTFLLVNYSSFRVNNDITIFCKRIKYYPFYAVS